MNIDLLFSNFELISTPEKIQKLKQAILQLAVKGRLVPQDPDDEPASELVKKIKAEKVKLIKEGKLKKEKPLPTITKEEIPNELPKGWRWVRFGEIISCYRGHNPPKHEFIKHPKEGYIRFIQITDFKTDKSAVYVPISDKLKYVNKGEIIMAAYRHIGKLSREMQGAFNVALCKIMEIKPMSRDYIETLTPSDFIREELLKESERAHIPSMHTEHLRSLVVPIPPLREQKRIVERVDELFSRADEIESKLKQVDEEIVHLNKSALNQLLESKNDDEFRKNFEFVIDNFDLLYSDERNVKELRQAILQLAVQGKLVPQEPNDEPASKLIKRIKAEKEKLIKEGKLRKEKPFPPISLDEIPFELPENWQWMRISEIYHDLGQNKPDKEFTYIDVSSIDKEFGIISDDLQVIKPVNAPSRARKIVNKGTVIYSTVRPYLLNIAIIDRNIEPPPIVSTAFAVMHPHQGVLNKYLYFYLKNRIFTDSVESKMVGMAYPAINDSQLKNCLFALPPLNEQKRIVEKVDQLMKLCDELESRISKSKEESERLIGAILREVFKQ